MSEPDFFLHQIMELWWLKLLITRTHFGSPIEFGPPKFYSIFMTKTSLLAINHGGKNMAVEV